MNLALPRGLKITVALALMPIVAAGAFDVFYFTPRWLGVQELLALAEEDERFPPPLLQALVFAANRGNQLGNSACRATEAALVDTLQDDRPVPRHARAALWCLDLRLRASQKDLASLVLAFGYAGHGDRGAAQASRSMFGKPLRTLSTPELASVVAALNHPALRDSPERLAARRDWLTAQLSSNP